MEMGHTVEQLLRPLKQGVEQGVHFPAGGTWGLVKVEGMLDSFLSRLPSGGVSTTHDGPTTGSLVDLEKKVGSSKSGLSANAHGNNKSTHLWDKNN